MKLYSGLSSTFISDVTHNAIAERLRDAFFRYFRYQPPPAEVNAWRNSLRAVADVFGLAHLNDQGVILEYQLPLTSKRLDCLVCGRDARGSDRAVIIELKQWERCETAAGDDLVSTWVGGAQRDVLHPSAQVRQYQSYLQDLHTAFYEPPAPIGLNSCAYLHNFLPAPEDALFAPKFSRLLADHPCFVARDAEAIAAFLSDRVAGGRGGEVLTRVEASRYRPSRKLMDHVAAMIRGSSEYVLLDEQLVVYQQVRELARRGLRDPQKTVLIVQGGPGTGKSVIAINLMADLLREGINAHYATGSRAFTETLRKVIGARGGVQFKYFNSYATAQPGDVDVLICDEAHRIRETSNDRYTPRSRRSSKRQVEELLDAASLAVFLIDDKQGVRPGEVGSSELIRAAATARGHRVLEHKLEAQFRCAGSDGFVNWINNTLGIERTANVLYEAQDSFDFQIMESPQALDAAIRQRAAEGFAARLVAGFCWPWSDPRPDGTLADDVVIGGFRRPWNAKPEARKLAPGIPKATLWAREPGGIDQVGCVYTAQGFEFDYVGVIWGQDLVYDLKAGTWRGDRQKSHDKTVARAGEGFLDLVKNTYRVLLSRGLKGCYVYFMDKATEQFVRSRMEVGEPGFAGVTAVPREPAPPVPRPPERMPFRVLRAEEVRPFENCVPILELAVAAGRFSEVQDPMVQSSSDLVRDPAACKWAELPEEIRPREGMFVARVVGESMNRRIPNSAWCLFRVPSAGSRQGRVVVAQHHSISDPETGGSYTIKIYESQKEQRPDGSWRHAAVILRPDSSMAGFEPLAFTGEDADSLRIVAELVAVLG